MNVYIDTEVYKLCENKGMLIKFKLRMSVPRVRNRKPKLKNKNCSCINREPVIYLITFWISRSLLIISNDG